MDNKKLDFLRYQFFPLLQPLKSEAKGKWGKMNGQQTVEHLSDFLKISTGKLIFSLVTTTDLLPRYREFMLSEKAFKENTRAPHEVLPEEPLPLRYRVMSEAINELKKELDDFFRFFEDHPLTKTLHPVFGELNYEEWIILHYKHVIHHLNQFELLKTMD